MEGPYVPLENTVLLGDLSARTVAKGIIAQLGKAILLNRLEWEQHVHLPIPLWAHIAQLEPLLMPQVQVPLLFPAIQRLPHQANIVKEAKRGKVLPVLRVPDAQAALPRQ